MVIRLPCMESWWVVTCAFGEYIYDRLQEELKALELESTLRLPHYTAPEANECTLCFEKRTEFVHCPSCVHEWCVSCERLWAKKDSTCPYCRVTVTGGSNDGIGMGAAAFEINTFDFM